MSDTGIHAKIAEVLARSEYKRKDWSGCDGSRWERLPELVRAKRIELKQDVAAILVTELELTDTVRLLRAAATWIAGTIAEDPSGEPWVMTRTLLNEMISRVDDLGGWPQDGDNQ